MRAPVRGKEESDVNRHGNAATSGGVFSDNLEGQQQVMKKGPWTTSEDAILLEYVRKHGEGNWNAVQKNSSLQRCGKSCRLRWANHLRPNLKKGSFSPEEEILILQLHAELGNKWARMAAQLPGRTDNEIKNYWNTRIKRRQRSGLPLYPPEIQRRIAFRNQRQESLMLLENPARPRNFLATVSSTEAPIFTNANNGNYCLGNFELGGPPQALHSPNFSMKMELPSNQLIMISDCGEKPPPLTLRQGSYMPFGVVRQDSQGVGEWFNYGRLHEHFPAADYTALVEPPQGFKCPGADPHGNLDCTDFSIGIHTKKQTNELLPSVNNDLSTMLEMIPTNPAAHTSQLLSDWCNSGPSSMLSEEDVRQEMQKLASALSMGHDWGFGSCSWDNIPSIS